MNRDDYGRIALGVVIGAVAAVAITKAGLTLQSATLRWIIYCVVAGIIVNTQAGMKIRLLFLAGFISALGLTGAVLWMALLGKGAIPSLSGVAIDFNVNPTFSAVVLGGLLVVSTLGVSIGAMARPATVELIQNIGSIELEKAKKIETFLKVLVSIAGTATLLLL